MPLDKSANCDAFWKNVHDLKLTFSREVEGEDRANVKAIAAASRTLRKAGGDPQKCLNKSRMT